ncbi:major facilitator superfamily MFS_1 [Dehalogenimonas lykanthroporepellens BL-DC-9]|jgi:Na+/melibiose symporter-like transporter|nr:major facilitator superfamily MFS_1 [Dehalogenimonas lykanthroporepellens BL-DC-9]
MKRLRFPKLGVSDYLKITILGLGLTALSQSFHGLILPLRVLDFVGEAEKNTALGTITFLGLIIAMLWQPVASAISDATSTRWGRRKPFVIGGVIALMVFLLGVGLAPSLGALFVFYCLMQLASNTAQGPYQGYIPELVPPDYRGRASSVKSLMEIIGGAVGVLVVGRLLSGYSADQQTGLWIALAILSGLLLIILLYLWRRLHDPPVTAPLPKFRNPLLSYRFNLREVPGFGWFLASRLLVLMAGATIQQFALYYVRDVIGVADPAGATAGFMVVAGVGMAASVFPAGYLADRYGRSRLSLVAALIGAAGIMILIIWPTLTAVYIVAAITGYATGTFVVVNWALATDLVVPGQEARYLAIVNMATAGGAAAARLIGPVIDHFNGVSVNLGYQVMLSAALLYFVIGGLLILKVKPPASR